MNGYDIYVIGIYYGYNGYSNLTALVGRDSFLSARSADFGPFSSFFFGVFSMVHLIFRFF